MQKYDPDRAEKADYQQRRWDEDQATVRDRG
jgi:hypothetical protein